MTYTNALSQHILKLTLKANTYLFFEVRYFSCTYMMYIGGADIVANKPMLFFDLVLFFSIHCYLCKKAFI